MAVEEIFHQKWSPGIGDPTIVGWFTVFAYLVVVVLLLGRRRTDVDDDLCCTGIWLLLALAMLFLAINKQLDLQSWLTMTLKEHALVHGWYQDRRSYQSLFIGGLGVFGLLLMGVLFWSVRERWRDFLIAGFGFGFLLVFVMARATSFHQIDAMINTSIVGFSLNGLFEITGIFLVGYGARHRTDDLAE